MIPGVASDGLELGLTRSSSREYSADERGVSGSSENRRPAETAKVAARDANSLTPFWGLIGVQVRALPALLTGP